MSNYTTLVIRIPEDAEAEKQVQKGLKLLEPYRVAISRGTYNEIKGRDVVAPTKYWCGGPLPPGQTTLFHTMMAGTGIVMVIVGLFYIGCSVYTVFYEDHSTMLGYAYGIPFILVGIGLIFTGLRTTSGCGKHKQESEPERTE